MLTLCGLALAVALGSSALAPAAAPEDEAPRCRKCDSTGRLPCDEHDEEICEHEDRVLYCSVVHDCPECAGVGYVDCPKCENEAALAAIDARKAEIAQWHEELKALDEPMGRPLRKVAGEHITLVWEMSGMKVGRQRLDGHQMMHLSIDRLERLWDDYVEVLGVPAEDMPGRPLILVWRFVEDHRRAAIAFAGMSGDGGVKLLSHEPVYSTDGSRRNFQDDEALHRALIHNTTHLLFTMQKPTRWLGNEKGGWIDAGVAHWFEERLHGLCTTFCYEEVATSAFSYKGGKFKLALRKLVAAEEAPPLAGLFARNLDELSGPEHAAALAVVDYLMQLDASKFNQLGVLMRSQESTRDALKEAYGLSPLVLESRVYEWVLETYPRR